VRESYRDPITTFATNVMGTVHVLEAARQTKCTRAMVIVTSDKCYENREWVWGYRETEALGGYDPYSSSKGCSELVTSAYRRSFLLQADIPVATARAGNVIGGGDWSEDRLIPDMIRSFIKGKTGAIRYPESTRPWQHVLEPLAGYLLLATKLFAEGREYADAWNFGPEQNDVKQVRWMANELVALWGEGVNWKNVNDNSSHEAKLLSLDISKAKNLLNWKPRWTSATALNKTVEWYRSWQAKDDMRSITLHQIAEYESSQTE